MTAGVQLHGVTQSAGAPGLPCSAKPEVSAEQRGARRASVCLQRREESILSQRIESHVQRVVPARRFSDMAENLDLLSLENENFKLKSFKHEIFKCLQL